jgi:hypothetical protein
MPQWPAHSVRGRHGLWLSVEGIEGFLGCIIGHLVVFLGRWTGRTNRSNRCASFFGVCTPLGICYKQADGIETLPPVNDHTAILDNIGD